MTIRGSLFFYFISVMLILAAGLSAAGDAKLLSRSDDLEPQLDRPISNVRQQRAIPDLVVVKLQADTEKIIGNTPRSVQSFGLAGVDRIMARFAVREIKRTFMTKTQAPLRAAVTDLSKIYSIYLTPGSNADLLVNQLSADPDVEYAEQIYPDYIDVTPNDPRYPQQVHYARIQAEAAWDIEQGSANVILAIIDTGVDWNHEDLAANIWTNLGEIADNSIDDDGNGYIDDVRGWDFVNVPFDWPADSQPMNGEDGRTADNDPDDFDGHGTHCSGIAAAVTNNSTGVAGTGWYTTIMPVRVGYTTSTGNGSIPWGYEGIVYAVDNGADIVSLSWGSNGSSNLGQDVINYAWDNGVIVIAAAGNDAVNNLHFPAAYEHAIAVAATGTVSDNLANFSNFGTWVDICAPGTSILSTFPGNTYGSIGGTSMSTPMVAGGVALLLSQFPTETSHEILIRLTSAADNIDDSNPDFVGQLGYGRMNLYQALTGTGIGVPNLSFEPTISDINTGDGDGIAEPGETVELIITVENEFLGDQVTNLNIALATDDYAITIINGATSFSTVEPLDSLDNAINPFRFQIAGTSIPHRAQFTLIITGDGGYSETFEFGKVIGQAPVLLVDDDDGGNNVEGFFFESLDALGVPYAYWSHQDLGAPTTVIDQFSTVVWLCEWTFPSLDNVDRSALGTFLDNGGNLFLSGQDIGWDMCDDITTFPNEYSLSGGLSKIWYENQLHCEYIADDASPAGQASLPVSGVSGNAIGDGLSFTISQPGRSSDNQYPSIIAPLTNAEAVFEYSPGVTGATLWSGTSKVVNFGFGFEAITDYDSRVAVMGRVLQWLNEFNISHTPLTDTEGTTIARIITATLDSETAPDSMAIYWSLDGLVPFNIEPMIESSGVYSGTIPAQAAGATVYYFIYAQAANGYLLTSPAGAPLAIHSYDVGPDDVFPVITDVSELPATIDNSGKYTVSARLTDNIGINPATAFAHFQLNADAFNSTLLLLDSGSVYSGEVDFEQTLSNNDVVSYFISVEDVSAAANRSESTPAQFNIVGQLVIDGFEAGVDNWIINQGWEPYFYAHTGNSAITESPTGYYADNSEYTLENKTIYNLSTRSEAYLIFWHIFAIGTGDSANLETSPDGQNWSVAQAWTGTNNYIWENAVVSLNDFIGETDLHLRYRLISDGAGNGDGWYIDDIVMYVDTTMLAIPGMGEQLPRSFALKQNYPNPFNPVTTIEYHLPVEAEVQITIYNIAGQVVSELINEVRPAGIHKLNFDATTMASGMYFYRIKTTGFNQTRKMILLK